MLHNTYYIIYYRLLMFPIKIKERNQKYVEVFASGSSLLFILR